MKNESQRQFFRPEVLERINAQSHGPILLARTSRSWAIVGVAALLAISTLLYLGIGTYKPRTIATGILVPQGGAIRVQAPVSAVVSERLVREGQSVRKGDVLFVLADERRYIDRKTSARVADLRAGSLAERRLSLMKLRDSTLGLGTQAERANRFQYDSIADELLRNQQEIDLQKRRLEASERAMQKHRSLAAENFISEVALQEKEDQAAALRAQLLALQRSRDQLQRTASALKSEFEQLPLRTASQLAGIDRDIAALSQEMTDAKSRDAFAITAPVDGRVTAINAEPGQMATSQALAVIVPSDAPMVAHLYAPSKAIGFVQVGQSVRLRYQPYPFQRFGMQHGTVAEVSASPLSPDDLALLPSQPTRESLYRVVVRLDKSTIQAQGREVVLLPGTALEADIEQAEQRLIDWVLSPLKSAATRL